MNQHSFDRFPSSDELDRPSEAGWEAPVPSRRQFASAAARPDRSLWEERLASSRARTERPVASERRPAPAAEAESRAARTHAERTALFRQLLDEIAQEEEAERRDELGKSAAPYRGPFRLEDQDRRTMQGWNSRLVGNRPLGDESPSPRVGYDDADFDDLLRELR